MLVYFALGDAKVWRWGSKPTAGPNANGFASQWTLDYRMLVTVEGRFHKVTNHDHDDERDKIADL